MLDLEVPQCIQLMLNELLKTVRATQGSGAVVLPVATLSISLTTTATAIVYPVALVEGDVYFIALHGDNSEAIRLQNAGNTIYDVFPANSREKLGIFVRESEVFTHIAAAAGTPTATMTFYKVVVP